MMRVNVRCGPNVAADAVVVPRVWTGQTAVILACGPSLTQSDVDACRDRARVICVNDSHRLAPWADVLYSSDNRWWAHYAGVPEFTGSKWGIAPLRPPPGWGVSVLKNTGAYGIECSPDGLRDGRNSGAAAINLAIHYGAANIILLGYDMGRTHGKGHFFGEHPANLRTDSPFHTFREMFPAMVPALAQLNVSVVNCSRESALECFPRSTLREALP